jgi:hypothetical protein
LIRILAPRRDHLTPTASCWLAGFAARNLTFDEHGFPESDPEAISNGVIEVV